MRPVAVNLFEGVIIAEGNKTAMRRMVREFGGIANGWTMTYSAKPVGSVFVLKVQTFDNPKAAVRQWSNI